MSNSFEIPRNQSKRLHLALLESHPTTELLDLMLELFLGKELGKLVNLSSVAATMPVVILNLLRSAKKEGWQKELIQGAHEDQPASPLLRDFIRELVPDVLVDLGVEEEVLENPLGADFLDPSRRIAFIGRKVLRKRLKELVTTDLGLTPKILTIESKHQKCGKTYTYEFIKYLAIMRKDKTVYIDLQDEIMTGRGLEEIVSELGSNLGIVDESLFQEEQKAHLIKLMKHLAIIEKDQTDFIDLQDEITIGNGLREIVSELGSNPSILDENLFHEEQKARWSKKTVNEWLRAINLIEPEEKLCWIVIDGINQVNALPADIENFIQELAKQIDQNPHSKCRLVLISYSGHEKLPIEMKNKIVTETIHQRLVESASDIRSFLRNQVIRMAGEVDNLDQAIERLYQSVKLQLANIKPENHPFELVNLIIETLNKAIPTAVINTREEGA